jgi:hypothetical protein
MHVMENTPDFQILFKNCVDLEKADEDLLVV